MHRQKVSESILLLRRIIETDSTLEFSVNGTALPNVDFDVGESYAGSLPISTNANDTNQLFFWFFPSENKTVGNEITIWLTGGVRFLPAKLSTFLAVLISNADTHAAWLLLRRRAIV